MKMTESRTVLDLQPEEAIDNACHRLYNDIPRYTAQSCTYNEFFWNYMHKNLPVVLTNVSVNWECRCNWTHLLQTNNNIVEQINFDYLRKTIGNCQVPVANCSLKYFNSHEKCEMEFFTYLKNWRESLIGGKTNNNGNCDDTINNLYLKDWHLKSLLPDYDFYHVPKHFVSDWLNEYLVNNQKDDYRFVYMGPKGTWTPFHADVFGSYSWSTNIFGCKKWILLPPHEEEKLCDRLGNFPFSIDENKLNEHNVKFYILHQRENEAIFVPSGWYHQVWNLTDTISINHNWFNACNLQRIWLNLVKNMQLVVAEIEDCRQMDNFDEHCQTMLRASFGLNYLDFLDILEYITSRRLNNSTIMTKIPKTTTGKSSDEFIYKLNKFHRYYDLKSIANVMQDMLQDVVVCNNRAVLYRRCLQLIENINNLNENL